MHKIIEYIVFNIHYLVQLLGCAALIGAAFLPFWSVLLFYILATSAIIFKAEIMRYKFIAAYSELEEIARVENNDMQ